MFPQRVKYSDRLLQRLHCIPLLTLHKAMQKQNISIGKCAENDAYEHFTFYSQLPKIPIALD